MPLVAAGLAVAAAGVALARPATRWRPAHAAAREARACLPAGRAWVAVAAASALVVAVHAATFVIAARTAGVAAPLPALLPLALLVLMGAALPNVAGWGPREGVTAWAFAAAGLGASSGVATAVVYGAMVFAASLPGALVLLAAAARGARWAPWLEPALARVHAGPDGAADA
jgi:hypothetical protein